MHHSHGKLGRIGAVLAAAAALVGWASPVWAQVPSLALTSHAETPDPNTAATMLLLISMATVVAIKRKYPEMRLFPLAPIPMPRRPVPRPRGRR